MKNILLFFLFVTGLSFSQNGGNIILEWKDNVTSSVGDVVVAIPQFQAKYMDFNPSAKTLRFSMSQPAASAVDPNSLRITNIIYESIAPELLGDLSRSALPGAINAKLSAAHARDDWYAVVSLNPIIKEGTSYKRVKSFAYSYTIDNSGLALRDGNTTNTVTNSVLASGEWYRFYIENSGVYKITKDFLRDLGFNVDTDPRNIKIYGNGGRMIPLLNSVDYPMDLAENAIQFIGEEDGAFNDGDYILFYAEGVDNWNADSGTYNNLYSDRSYYYVTSTGGVGKRILPMTQPAGAPSTILTSFDEYRYHEVDLINIARLGRKWHGEAFNVDDEQDFGFTFPDIDSPVTVTVSAAAKSIATTSMTVTANNAPVGSFNFTAAAGLNLATDGSITGTIPQPSGSTVTVSLDYNNGGVPGSNAWLNYIELKAKRKLRGNGSQFRFRYNDAGNTLDIAEYQLSNAAGISEVWDITNIYDATKVVNASNQQNFSFKAVLNQKREYIAVVPNNYFSPARETNTKVANQNLKGTVFRNAQGQFQDVDYIIVTPAALSGPAERLATLHRTQSGLNVKVITLDNIYQEFSSGKQDIGAIRNFVKYVYENASSPDKKIKYLNLFGDASFDYKDRIPNNTNIVPAFHAYVDTLIGPANYSQATTFVSDEFFVMMDMNEGLLQGAVGEPDVAVGRMLVSSVQQANEMVDKVYEYKNAESYGRWRNEYVLIADDVDVAGVDGPFVFTMEGIAQDLAINKPFINVRKVYTDSFVQQVSSGGERYPDAKEQIIRSINYGSLVVNYLGHGGESGMATERIFETSDAQRLTNRFKYPLFITTTCELTKFDNPYLQTAGEFIYWNPAGGAITMITTTRAIFANVAFDFNEALTSRLYAFGAAEYPSMAEAVRRTKVEMANEFSRVISFIGDPALKLAVPKPKIILTEINDVPVASSTEVLEALSYVKLGGRVTNEDGSPLNFYNGELAVTVFDKPINRVTLNNDDAIGDHDNNGTTANAPMVIPFATLGETIFRGNATITNGQFEFGFVVPRDIRMPISEGRISFYAKRNAILEDQTGHDSTIKIGGIDENAVADNTGPKVRIYMNDESFVSGSITNASPILLAFLEDEHGMNTASGIGHDMIAILDGDETNPFVVNDYYEANVNDHTRGELRFPFANLAKGLHTLTFRAWDVYNNLVTAELTFVVVGDDEMQIEKVLNYPNPFVSYTEFWFTHNRPFEPLDVQVQVFTITGKVVKTINQTIVTDGFLSRDIRWDGRDDFGDRIGKGVYVYKLTVKSSTTNKRAEKYEKLVLL